MNRWLLNTFTTFELGLLIVGGMVVLAIVGLLAVRRFAPSVLAGESNEATAVFLGLFAAIYGIVLAFVIVSLYDSFRTTQSDIRNEASATSMVYRDTRGFDPPAAAKLKRDIGAYIHAVTTDEWPALAHGHESQSAWVHIDNLYTDLQAYKPTSESRSVFYSDAVSRLNEMMSARRERLNDAEEGIPITFEVLLIGGALLTLAFALVFGVKSFRLHMGMAVAVAALIGFNLLLALILDFPFSGRVSVSNDAFHQGSLAAFVADAK